MSVYLNSLRNLKTFSDNFGRIYAGHGTEAINPSIIDELISGSEDILEGRRVGKHIKTFAGEGLLCRLNSCGIIYNDNKLL